MSNEIRISHFRVISSQNQTFLYFEPNSVFKSLLQQTRADFHLLSFSIDSLLVNDLDLQFISFSLDSALVDEIFFGKRYFQTCFGFIVFWSEYPILLQSESDFQLLFLLFCTLGGNKNHYARQLFDYQIFEFVRDVFGFEFLDFLRDIKLPHWSFRKQSPVSLQVSHWSGFRSFIDTIFRFFK